jgi:hypothetical protein
MDDLTRKAMASMKKSPCWNAMRELFGDDQVDSMIDAFQYLVNEDFE